MGAGEILVNSIDCDGLMEGYDLELIREILKAVKIPVIALGGAGAMEDLSRAYYGGKASAVAAGSLFVHSGKNKGILVNYPEKEELEEIFDPKFSKNL